MTDTVTMARLVAHMRSQDAETNARGATVRRWFNSAERYDVDCAPDFTEAGWLQFDTSSDAGYFGVWVCPCERLTLSYAEGDWTMCECPDVETYNAEIAALCTFHDEGRIALVIHGNGSATEYRQDRAAFFIGGAQ